MLFTTALKDYLDQINNVSILLNENFTLFIFLKSFFIYFVNSIKFACIYLFSFKWMTDFIELPAIFKHNYIAILEGKNVFKASLETEIDKSFFLFLENSPLNSKNFLTGVLNSFFLILPFSVPQLIAIRSFLINGLPAGISAAAGTILGQITFFSCILFGLEFIIVPFLTFEPLNILLGLVILVNFLYKMTHTPTMAIFNINQKKALFEFFGLNFILAWTEQACVFNYFGNLTVNGTNLLQTSENNFFFLTQFFYLAGLLIGSIAWTALFGFTIMNLRNFFLNKIAPKVPFVIVNERIHYVTLLITTILCFSNVPYYGFDYLLYGPLGFINEDKALEEITPKVKYVADNKKLAAKTGLPGLAVEMAANSLPFDKADQIQLAQDPSNYNYNYLKYEQYSLDSETIWKHKRYFRSEIGLVGSRKQIETVKKDNKRKETKLEIPKYETKDFELYHQIRTTKEKNADLILNALFRQDIYIPFKDSKSNRPLQTAKVHRQFREKYYTNPVYKLLINLDMAPFLVGQPDSYTLTAADESDLFQRRVILHNYLDSIQDYQKLLKKEKESYAEKVYNQQFKGSLSLVRSFAAVSLNFDDNLSTEPKSDDNLSTELETTKKVLKFDQSRYNEFLNEGKTLLHEELSNSKNYNSKYMILNNATPLYIGWDGALRKFIIKNVAIPGEFYSGNVINKTINETQNEFPPYFSFQAWSPSIKKHKPENNTDFKLPALVVSSDDLVALREIVDFKLYDGLTRNQILQDKITDFKPDRFLTRLPTYNWRWKKPGIDSENYLKLGNAIPPRLDGITWPGVNDKILAQKLIES